MRSILLCAALLGACGSDTPKLVDAPASSIDAARAIDASIDAADDPRGPKTFPLTGGANALLWDTATQALYLTDSNADALLEFTDANGVQTVGSFPAATAGVSLGDLVKRADGTILTTNFGFGTQGTLFAMASNHTSSQLTGLDAARRRIGLAQDSAGVLYETYFVSAGMGMQNGGVARVTIAGSAATETEIAGVSTTAGFKKLVGLVATPTAVFVSDQTQKTIFKITIPGLVVTSVAVTPSADLLMMMPNGDLLTGGGPAISRVTQAGVVTQLFAGFEQVRGLAYDPTGKRLFIIEHSATVGTPDKLHVRPLDN